MVSTPVQKNQDNFFDELLSSIQPDEEEYIEKRIHHIGFAKIITWICINSRKKNIFKRSELRKFIRLTNSRVHEILEGLCGAGVLSKNYDASGYVSYVIVVKDGTPKVRKYFEKALKTLGKKPKRKISFELEEDIGESYL